MKYEYFMFNNQTHEEKVQYINSLCLSELEKFFYSTGIFHLVDDDSDVHIPTENLIEISRRATNKGYLYVKQVIEKILHIQDRNEGDDSTNINKDFKLTCIDKGYEKEFMVYVSRHVKDNIMDMVLNNDMEGYRILHKSIMGNMTSKDLKYDGGYSYRRRDFFPINYVHFCIIHDERVSSYFKDFLKKSNLLQNGPWLTYRVYDDDFYKRKCIDKTDIWGWLINEDGEWIERYPELGVNGMNKWKYFASIWTWGTDLRLPATMYRRFG